MNKNNKIILFCIISVLLFLLTYLIISKINNDKELNLAYTSYKQGERALTIAERQNAFNESLKIYKSLETRYSPYFGSGKIDYNIANNYFQLEQYPLAVLYYLRAQNLMPRNEQVQNNLDKALSKLNIKADLKLEVTNYLSLPEKLQIFVILGILLFILISFWIWHPFKGLKILFGVTSLLFFTLLCHLFYYQFMIPSYAVILKANLLYKDAGLQFGKVLELPIPPGTRVKVLNVEEEGKWLKIVAPDGVVGYIPYTSLQII